MGENVKGKVFMYLVIDTTGKEALVALGDKQGVLSLGEWTNDNTLSQRLQPEIDKLLQKVNEPVTAILCVTGPGSFTGIRVGVATANAIAYALSSQNQEKSTAGNTPIVPVTRFEIYEELNPEISEPKVILLENIKDPIDASVAYIAKAMAAHKLGQDEYTKVALERLQDLRKEEPIAGIKEAQAFLDEAEKFLSNEKE